MVGCRCFGRRGPWDQSRDAGGAGLDARSTAHQRARARARRGSRMMRELYDIGHCILPKHVARRDCDRVPLLRERVQNCTLPAAESETTSGVFLQPRYGLGGIFEPFHRTSAPTAVPPRPSVKVGLPPLSPQSTDAASRHMDGAQQSSRGGVERTRRATIAKPKPYARTPSHGASRSGQPVAGIESCPREALPLCLQRDHTGSGDV